MMTLYVASLIDYLNPLTYMSAEKYTLIWQHLFATVLEGFWARFFASFALMLSFFVGVYRQQVVPGVIFFFVAVAIAYGSCIARLAFGW